jgi:NAD(P)-dependent dehydrogenase (short-subunit alcohol dehydrogenase family)
VRCLPHRPGGRAEQGRGKIITLASSAYNSGRKGASHYCASKAGVVMFTKVLAMEMGPHHVNVNCVAPGLVTVERDEAQVSEEVVKALLRDAGLLCADEESNGLAASADALAELLARPRR